MIELTRKQFIKDQNYISQCIIYILFAIVGIVITGFEISLVKTFDFNSMFQLGIITIFVFIPFGIYLGIFKIIVTLIKIKKVKKGMFKIIEREVVDKLKLDASSRDKYCQILFSDTEGMWVSERKDKQIKVGDMCYLIYLSGNDYPCAIYSKRKTKLASDMLSII